MKKQPMIIGLIGKKESGKDTFCQIVSQLGTHHVHRLAFADALKAELAQRLNITVEFINANKQIFRTALQWYGTEYCCNLIGKDYWIKRLAEFEPDKLNIVTDVRFLNEADYLRKKGAVMVQIVRDRRWWNPDQHISETEMDGYLPDYVVNNSGSLTQFCDEVTRLLPQIMKGFLDR